MFGFVFAFATINITKQRTEPTTDISYNCARTGGIELTGCPTSNYFETRGYPLGFKTTTYPSGAAAPHDDYSLIGFAVDIIFWAALVYLLLTAGTITYAKVSKTKVKKA